MVYKKELTPKLFVKFVGPSILMMLCISLYTVIDALFVARFVNITALGALNIVMPLYSIAFACGIMFAAGGGAIIGIQLGQGKRLKASKNFTQLLLGGLIFGILAAVICLIFRKELVSILGAKGSFETYALDYGLYVILTFPFLISKIIFESMFRIDGKPGWALISTIAGGLINIILDYVLIVHIKMGIAGAGLGTLAGIVIPLPLGIYYFSSKKSLLNFRKTWFNAKFFLNTLFNGSSEMVNEAAMAFTVFILNMLALRYYGENGVSAISILFNIYFLLCSFYIGFAEGVMPLFSYNHGAQDASKIKLAFKYSLVTLILTSPLSFICAELFAPELVSIFADAGSKVYNIAVPGLRIFAVSFVFAGLNVFASGMFTAFGNGKISALISFVKTFGFFTVAAFLLPCILADKSLWLVTPISEIAGLIMALYFIIKYRKKHGYY